ncbi:FecR domain-containing protein [Novosphingobium sp. ST904]|uniref:FecR family protein n=1 Tax=Novosphingobium sp. ST904 TaxID=1684385 RepID=UPI0006C87CF6|nr:FecR domain-containing protein [Novosphingobium sp. ST904]KPH67134.1 hypothetical protein ADT71_02745 [Novosphingobium sp. ST904]TCM24929.1 FecR family protein [Novosphingobium sp. ST904]
MSNHTRSSRPSLRDEAADWFALMRGPDAPAKRSEFEAWLAADALHRDAYNRIGETFSLGKGLKEDRAANYATIQDAGTVTAVSSSRGKFVGTMALASVLLIAVVISTAMLMRTMGGSGIVAAPAEGLQTRDIVTSRGEIRTFALADGSHVTLDTGSEVTVSLSPTRRDLRLVRGRARFAVAHEGRPFVVAAAGGSVIARGTVFDVTLHQHGGAVVDLIEGKVDVLEGPDRPRGSGSREARTSVRQLVSGHSLAFGDSARRPAAVPFTKADWPEGLRDFRAVRLGDLVADANRYGSRPIVLASSDLSALQVSGTFRLQDARRLAFNLADLLDLTVQDEPERIVLSRR